MAPDQGAFFWAGVLESNARTESDIGAVEQAMPDRPTGLAELLAVRAQATTALLDQLGHRAGRRPCPIGVDARRMVEVSGDTASVTALNAVVNNGMQ